ncbi:MAG: hypothetical protein C7B46_09330 [Sulfobacillus benefaciens]|uniref:DNA polymerase III subunit delta n=1 Tax=Sulfobacillus benefaciens TaxID=453960 RepID=A0A2T2XGG3_9FIRM|nr:MAG: hypothetical protein C7B46_09330 [Sulfobacillus benefaciens]
MKNSSHKNPSRLDSWPQIADPFAAGLFPQSALVISDTPLFEPGVSLCRSLLCEEPEARSICRCRSCQTDFVDHPDIHLLSPSPHTIRVADVRMAVQSLLYRPLWSSVRIIWIQAADTLTPESANLLLKAVEEPAPYVHFVLTTNNPDQVLPTIRSRCQRFVIADPDSQPIEALPPDWMMARPLLPDHVVQAARFARKQFRQSHHRQWLGIWEELWQAYDALAANANQDIVREQLRRLWTRR